MNDWEERIAEITQSKYLDEQLVTKDEAAKLRVKAEQPDMGAAWDAFCESERKNHVAPDPSEECACRCNHATELAVQEAVRAALGAK